MFFALFPSHRRARRAEKFIVAYELPPSVRTKFEHETEGLDWDLVEQGLREWLICCAYRRRKRPLGMPSRAVDYAWHAFILDTAAYRDFCERAYGTFLDHIPDTAMSDGGNANLQTVLAWDASRASRDHESVLWDLDQRLDLLDGLGLSVNELAKARSSVSGIGGGSWLGPYGGCGGGDGGIGSCGGGGGCGGGGCGGGA